MNRINWLLLHVAAYTLAGIIIALVAVPYSILWLCTIPHRKKLRPEVS